MGSSAALLTRRVMQMQHMTCSLCKTNAAVSVLVDVDMAECWVYLEPRCGSPKCLRKKKSEYHLLASLSEVASLFTEHGASDLPGLSQKLSRGLAEGLAPQGFGGTGRGR